MTNWLSIVQTMLKLAPAITQAVNTGPTLKSVTALITDPDVEATLVQIGSSAFPQAAPALQIVGGILASYNTNYVKWLQGALNTLYSAGLTVDGDYGPKTTAAVKAAQQKLGIVVDGLAGDVTSAALQAVLAKQ